MKSALVALVVVCGLSACGDSSTAAAPASLPPLPAPSSAIPSPTATPAAVLKPKIADEATPAGAEAFARYWMLVADAAFASLNPAALERLSGPRCATCMSYIASIRESGDNGERYEGGKITVKSAAATPLSARSSSVLLTYDVTVLRVYDRSGQLIDTVPEKRRAILNFELQRQGSGWFAKQLLQI